MNQSESVELKITRDYMMAVRQALFLQLDALEILLGITPRTAEIRKQAKEQVSIIFDKQEKETCNYG